MSQFPQGQIYQHEDRSTLILVLGILSIVMCNFTGPFAWVMGKNDLARIDAGTMDPTNRGITKGGMICGIVGTALLALSLLLMLLWIVIIVIIGVSAATGAAGP